MKTLWWRDAISPKVRYWPSTTQCFEGDTNDVKPWVCRCRSSLCQSSITGKDWRLKELQERFKGDVSVVHYAHCRHVGRHPVCTPNARRRAPGGVGDVQPTLAQQLLHARQLQAVLVLAQP